MAAKRQLRSLDNLLKRLPKNTAKIRLEPNGTLEVAFFDRPEIVLPHQLPPQQELPAAPALPEIKEEDPLKGPALDMADLVLEVPKGMLAPVPEPRGDN